MPERVLQHDDRVVHHDADRDRQREQREVVDREAEEIHDRERRDDRRRDRESGDDRGADVAQEDEDDQHDEDRRDEQGEARIVDRVRDEHRSVERALEPDADRQRLLNGRELRTNAPGHVDEIRLRLPHHADRDRGRSLPAEDGAVVLGPEDDRSIFRWKGTPSVAIGVVRQSKANLIDVARRIRAELPAIQQTLPVGVRLESAFDGSVFVTHSIDDARLTLLIAAILVVLIIFVFLRNVRATIIPGLAIPASIIATFAIMYFLGFSINNFTLLALTIAIGIVVDDAIIVLENAFRHQEELHETPE